MKKPYATACYKCMMAHQKLVKLLSSTLYFGNILLKYRSKVLLKVGAGTH